MCDQALNQMLFRWISINAGFHIWKNRINQWLWVFGVLWSPGFVLDLPPCGDFWVPCRNACRLLHPSCIHILHWSLKRSVKRTWTGSTFSTNESAWSAMVTGSQSRVWSLSKWHQISTWKGSLAYVSSTFSACRFLVGQNLRSNLHILSRAARKHVAEFLVAMISYLKPWSLNGISKSLLYRKHVLNFRLQTYFAFNTTHNPGDIRNFIYIYSSCCCCSSQLVCVIIRSYVML